MRRSSRSRKKALRAGRIRIFAIFFVIIGLVVLGSISHKIDFFHKNVVEAKSVVETLDKMGEKSLINAMVAEEIKMVEEEEARKKVEEERRRQEELLKRQNSNRKIAYLTFDDGPSSKITPEILDILGEYNVKATFFVVGNMAETYPEILRRTYEEGHAIGNHSYSHNYGYLYESAENFLADFKKTEDILKGILGEDFETKLIRFPGGSFGKKKNPMKNAVTREGYRYYDWNALNGDAESLKMSKRQLINRVKETTKNKKEVIILMHDTNAKSTTAASLREVLDYLISQGFEFEVLN
ncbi:polysaccharide deacetylase family protein [Tissierellaceae bacterium HCP3S3_D8]